MGSASTCNFPYLSNFFAQLKKNEKQVSSTCHVLSLYYYIHTHQALFICCSPHSQLCPHFMPMPYAVTPNSKSSCGFYRFLVIQYFFFNTINFLPSLLFLIFLIFSLFSLLIRYIWAKNVKNSFFLTIITFRVNQFITNLIHHILHIFLLNINKFSYSIIQFSFLFSFLVSVTFDFKFCTVCYC